MIATFWLFSILSTTMLREIECMYDDNTPIIHQYTTNQNKNRNGLILAPALSLADDNSFDTDDSTSPFDLQDVMVVSEKRTKPSLSIANSLDVLRQRLLLEIARRHMRENSKQIQKNRAHLKNIGKRVNQMDYLDVHNRYNKDKRMKLTSASLSSTASAAAAAAETSPATAEEFANQYRNRLFQQHLQQQQQQQEQQQQEQLPQQQQQQQHQLADDDDYDFHMKYLYSLKNLGV